MSGFKMMAMVASALCFILFCYTICAPDVVLVFWLYSLNQV
jgi:hypothetical protein